MVCEKCEKKLTKIVTPDSWKAGARNTLESGGRKINENKLLTKRAYLSGSSSSASSSTSSSASSSSSRASAASPYQQYRDCRICKSKTHQAGYYYCQACAYKKGICSMCGIKILSTKNYSQSST